MRGVASARGFAQATSKLQKGQTLTRGLRVSRKEKQKRKKHHKLPSGLTHIERKVSGEADLRGGRGLVREDRKDVKPSWNFSGSHA